MRFKGSLLSFDISYILPQQIFNNKVKSKFPLCADAEALAQALGGQGVGYDI